MPLQLLVCFSAVAGRDDERESIQAQLRLAAARTVRLLLSMQGGSLEHA
jgi:hypothetical protein